MNIISPFETEDDSWDAPVVTQSSIARENAARMEREAAHAERMAAYKDAYDANNLTTSALRDMSYPKVYRNRTVDSSGSASILPTDGSAHLQHVDEAWQDNAPEKKCLAADRNYVDRMGRTVQVYTNCPPPAQRDFGIEHGEERLRRSLGKHAGLETIRRVEMSNDDLPFTANAGDAHAIELDARSDVARHVAVSVSLNRTHQEEDAKDWDRSELYDGYNLKRSNESRASRLVRTQRSTHELTPELGQGQTAAVDRAPVAGRIVPRSSAPLPENVKHNSRGALFNVPMKPERGKINLSTPSARAEPTGDVRPIALTLPLPPQRIVDAGRGPTARPELAQRDTVAQDAAATLFVRAAPQFAERRSRPLDEKRQLKPPSLVADNVDKYARPSFGVVQLNGTDASEIVQHANAEVVVQARPVFGKIILGDSDTFLNQPPRATGNTDALAAAWHSGPSVVKPADAVSFPGEVTAQGLPVLATTMRDASNRLAQDARGVGIRSSGNVHDSLHSRDRSSKNTARVPFAGVKSTDRTDIKAYARPTPPTTESSSWRQGAATRVRRVNSTRGVPATLTTGALPTSRVVPVSMDRSRGKSVVPRMHTGACTVVRFTPLIPEMTPESNALRDVEVR